MSDLADFRVDGSAEARVLHFSGRMTMNGIGTLPARIDAVSGHVKAFDLSSVTRIDTLGAWLVHRHSERLGAEIVAESKDARRLIELVSEADRVKQMPAPPMYPFYRVLGQVGDATMIALRTLVGLLGFLGAIVLSIGNVIRHPRRFRLNAVVQRFEVVGVSALGIIGLMSFLIGIVIAQQGAVQLRQFGAEAYTINLVGRITLRELGVLMTAIMVAGRSGSAFAAQLGTMKLTEEIDAMRTIGVSPMEALVLPRLIASVMMMPLLGFYASVMSILGGGLLCWLVLEIPPATYVQRIGEVVPITDLYIGLIKAPVFGFIIALAGCFQGMQVESDAEQVGLRTTSAVVQAIFLVIVLDAFFAVFFTAIGWN